MAQSRSCHRPGMPASTPQPSLRLPLDVIGVIAECLSGSYHYGSVARLGSTCKLVREEVLPVLYETLTWDNPHQGTQRDWWHEVLTEKGKTVYKFPEGWKYTKIVFIEKAQHPSWSALAWSSYSQTDMFPSQQFLITRDLQTFDTTYIATLNVVTYAQSSVSFFIALFGTASHPSILDTPLKIDSAKFKGKKPTNAKFVHAEDMRTVHFHPNAFLHRGGRTSDDLGLKESRYFSGDSFEITFQPSITRSNISQVKETMEEVMILLPKSIKRISLQILNDASFFKCIRQAIANALPRQFRTLDFVVIQPMSITEWLGTLTSFAKLFTKHWDHVKPYTTPRVGFFIIAFRTYVPNQDAPDGQDSYTIEGGLFAQETGFELVAHCTKRIPDGNSDELNFSRKQIFYKSFCGAEDRGALLEAADTLNKLESLLIPIDAR